MKIYSEITPLRDENIFVIQNHKNAVFDYPIHLHPEFELNLVMNCTGRRIIGDSVNEFQQTDLVLLGPNLYHKWERTDNNKSKASVITIQFDKNLLDNSILTTNSLRPIKKLLENSFRGLSFEGDTKRDLIIKLHDLINLSGFDATIKFLSILNDLAISRDYSFIAGASFSSNFEFTKNQKIHKTYDYIIANYQSDSLSLSKIAQINNMSDSAFSHFFKKRTNKNFTQFVIEFRITQTIRLLQETNKTIREICYECGFNNISNFNRIFKKKMNVTPKEYRKNIEHMSNINTIGYNEDGNINTYTL
ncbi:AraC family transcriptional regulator [Winogradskyella sediminis]|uniref:AraC-type DNA-binding protein n=1 Tax=Winogradskyella sediminis TaxID=1382466 RepID=A0A1H1Q3U4_9FLAO|nr:AraC family transcriptional regulator [Winogradskyella sediminis]REG89887.1 AraC-like DNA-binding protein [Winogradskyella sediminis]SDS18076.1 AraC-type DNA-binding protein [Winogradskyella sediminis]